MSQKPSVPQYAQRSQGVDVRQGSGFRILIVWQDGQNANEQTMAKSRASMFSLA